MTSKVRRLIEKQLERLCPKNADSTASTGVKTEVRHSNSGKSLKHFGSNGRKPGVIPGRSGETAAQQARR